MRLLDLLPPNYVPSKNQPVPPVPTYLLTISGNKTERLDVENESSALFRVLGSGRRYEFRSESIPFQQILSEVIFAGYLSGMQLGDSYVEWALSRRQSLPIEEHPELFRSAQSYSNEILNEPAFPVSGSIPTSVVRLAELLRKHKAYGFTAILIGGNIVAGQPLSPFLVFESSVEGTASYFVIAVGTAAAERVAKYVRTIGEEKHRPEIRRRRRRSKR
ncbi:MAG: hypothetical protein ABSB53_03830 [Nitrososphaerales archaeon]